MAARVLPPNQRAATGRAVNPPKRSRRVAKKQPPNKKAARRKTRLNEPLFPGGVTTYGEFLRGRKAAVRAEFAPQEEQINQAKKEIPAWYQDYLAKLQGLQTQTAEQYQGLQSQAGSLAQPLQANDTEQAKAAGDARTNIIKALQASLLQQQGAQMGKLQQFEGIAGQRKIQRQEEVGKAEKELAQAKGDFRTKYTVEAKQREFENALAASQFGLKQQEVKNDLKTNETAYKKEFSKQAAKFGFSPKDWQALGPRGRAERIRAQQKASGKKPESLARIQKKEEIKIAAKYGYGLQQWRALKPQQRAAIIRKENDKGDGDGEFSPRSDNQRGEAATNAAQWKSFAEKLKSGEGIGGVNKKGHKRSRADVAKTILGDPKTPEPVIVSATLDAVYNGYISRDTAKRLHGAGFKVKELAQALGVPTYSEWAKGAYKRPNPKKALGRIPIAGQIVG